MRDFPINNRDLKRYSFRRRLCRAGGYVLWMAAWCGGAFAYNAGHDTYAWDRSLNVWRLVILLGAAAVIGFFLFKIPKLIAERGGEGVVIESGMTHTYESSADPGIGNRLNYDFRMNTYLILADRHGRHRRVRFEMKPGFYLYYYPGTKVRCIKGLPYPLADPAHSVRPPRSDSAFRDPDFDDLSGGRLCVACGLLNAEERTVCAACGLSLLDPEEIFR